MTEELKSSTVECPSCGSLQEPPPRRLLKAVLFWVWTALNCLLAYGGIWVAAASEEGLLGLICVILPAILAIGPIFFAYNTYNMRITCTSCGHKWVKFRR